MRDPFEEHVSRIGGPRPLDPEFRTRLERAIVEASGGEAAVRWRIDGPRDLPGFFRARLEAGLASPRPRSRTLTRLIAAAITMMLAAAATLVVADRLGAPRGTALPRAIVGTGSTSPAARPKGSLQAFRSSSAFLAYVRGEALKLVGPYGLPDLAYGGYGNAIAVRGRSSGVFAGPMSGPPVAAPGAGGVPAPVPMAPSAPGSFSQTNVQEAGVDEPDIVKTDGRRLVVLSGPDLRILDVRGATARIRGSLRILNGVGVFLVGDKVIHFASLYQAPPEAVRTTHAIYRPWTKVSVIDISNPASPKVVSAMSIEGNFVGARLARGVVRLIVQSGALGPAPVLVRGGGRVPLADVLSRTKVRIRTSSVGDWLPHYVVRRAGRPIVTGHVHDWNAVSRPPDRAGLSMLTLLTIDPDDPRPDKAASVIGAGEIIYSSADNLYVTSGRLADMLAVQRGKAPKGPITRIHKFDVRDPARAVYRGSGVVPGLLLNQFSLSENAGYLRVATTLAPQGVGAAGAASRSSVFVLREAAGKLVVVGSLGDLGVGERIYSVRFVGSKAYVVTFRLLDPLFVVDLRVPSRPRLSGSLKVPGYSGYLHPLSDTLLLGVGRDADSNGAAKGVQLSLFDVSEPAHPRRLDDLVVGTNGSSEVEDDHHSFLYWAPRRLAVVPATLYGMDSASFIGAVAVTISAAFRFGRPVRLSHAGRLHTENADLAIRRSLVIGSRLVTISDAGVLFSDLRTLGTRGWIPFQD